jgi:phosphoadenosine phosphosulfate reductase
MVCVSSNGSMRELSIEIPSEQKMMVKIGEARDLIRQALKNAKNPVIAFSGGKDSLIVLTLVREIDPTVPAVFCNTGIEYKETLEYVKTIPNLIELHPDPKFKYFRYIREHGENKKGGNAKGAHELKCCLELKGKPAKKYYKQNNVDLVFTGITRAESHNRAMFLARMGPYYFYKQDKYWKCHPIYNWNEREVWDYIIRHGLEYNKLYCMSGMRRCGCEPCVAYKNWREVTSMYNPKTTKTLERLIGVRNVSL